MTRGPLHSPQIRRALAEDSRRVHAHLAGLRAIDFAGKSGDLAYEQWQAWMKLQSIGGRKIPPDFKLPSVGLAWNAIITDLDPRSRYRAFEASTMMALRKSLRRGSVWVNHSIGHRSSQAMLLADTEWTRCKEQHY